MELYWKVGEDLKYIAKILDWQKGTFDFHAYYWDLNMIFVFDTKCYGSSTGFIQDYNEIMKHVPNPVANQTKGLLARHFLTNNTNKRVIVKWTTFCALSKNKDKTQL